MIEEFVLSNSRGLTATFLNYGAILKSLQVPDRNGKLVDIVLGFDDPTDYREKSPYFGAIVGRVANRIANAQFELNGKTYVLAPNEKPNHLHGGKRGFDKVAWQAERVPNGVRFQYRSPDGEEGYPGNLNVAVQYALDDTNALRIDYRATTDQATPINLTQHSYFNLAGHDSGDILGHELSVDASHYVAVDDALIPTGALQPVRGTDHDFTQPARLGDRVARLPGKIPGFDECFVFTKNANEKFPQRARLREPQSGRELLVYTTEPGLQLYTGNRLNGVRGKGGVAYERYQALCLECQHFPDSVHHPEFPNTILKPGEVYTQTTVYRVVQS